MKRQQTSLFIADTSSGFDSVVLPETYKRYGALITSALKRRLKSHEHWELLGRALVVICDHAHAARQINVLREVSEFLSALPVRPELRTIALYYRAQVLHRTGELKAAQLAVEELATHPRFPWKPRAVATLATCYFDLGKLDAAMSFYLEAVRGSSGSKADVLTWLRSQWMIGRIWSVRGDHDCALKSLESLYPLVREVAKIHPAIYYDYLNSRAVRLIHLNRLDEAERLNRITLASPLPKQFFPFYETCDEIREKRDAIAGKVFVNLDTISKAVVTPSPGSPSHGGSAVGQKAATPVSSPCPANRLGLTFETAVPDMLSRRIAKTTSRSRESDSAPTNKPNPEQARTVLLLPDTSKSPSSSLLTETQSRYGHLISWAVRRHLTRGEDWEVLGRTLVAICHHAHAARQITVLREVSDFLYALPVRPELRTIGLYYQAQVLHRTGELKAAQLAVEELATHPQFPWKPRAVATLATCHFDSGDLDTAMALYVEAVEASRQGTVDALTWLRSQWMIGRIWSVQDDHINALKSLENLEPLVRHVAQIHPGTYYDYLNSRAVRLLSLNRLDEAERLNRITLASPLPKEFFPFEETRDEIREKREAAAATLFVNIDIVPRTEPTLLQEKTPDASSDIDACPRGVRESDKNLDPESKPDLAYDLRAEASSVKPESKPQSKPCIHRNRVLEVRIAIILCSSHRKSAQFLPLPGMPPLLPTSVGVPDNRRPRSPPNHSKNS